MISNTTNRVTYSGDGSSALFAFQNEFHSQSDLKVYIWNSSRAQVISTKVLNIDYTISGVADAQNRYTNGAYVVFNSSPSSTDHITIVREMNPTQPFNLQFNQVIPNAELIKALDRLALLEQRFYDLNSLRILRIQDSYPLTFSSLLPAQLIRGAPLIIGSSGQTIEMGVAAVSGSSAATYFGILPVPNGGTGLDFSLLQGVIYSPGNNSTFQNINNGTPGQVLTSNGSSAPTFQSIATTLINSGVLGVSYGGTGTGTSYIQYGVMFASSATQVANTQAGGVDVPLIGNGAAVPSFRALNLSSGSTVTGILAQSNGGTGSASSWPLYSVIAQTAANSLGPILPAQAGYGLIANASSAPTFQAITLSPVAPLQISAATVLTIADTVVLASSSNYNITMYDANGNEGRIVKIKRKTMNLGSPINIIGSGSQISTTIDTLGEMVELQARTGAWEILQRDTKTADILAGSVLFSATTTAPTRAAARESDFTYWRREGDNARFRMEYHAIVGSGSIAGSGDYIFNLPPGLIIDSSRVSFSTTVGSPYDVANTLGVSQASAASFLVVGAVYAYGTSAVRGYGVNATQTGVFGSAFSAITNPNLCFSLDFSVPILGWKA